MIAPVDKLFEAATLDLAGRLWPKGWEASIVAPSTLASMTAFYKAHGHLQVSSLHCERTIFSDASVNYAFRAWHDWHHVALQASFDRLGEQLVHDAMARDLSNWLANHYHKHVTDDPHASRFSYHFKRCHALLKCDNIGQLDHWEALGAPPVDQRAFALGYLAAHDLLA